MRYSPPDNRALSAVEWLRYLADEVEALVEMIRTDPDATIDKADQEYYETVLANARDDATLIEIDERRK